MVLMNHNNPKGTAVMAYIPLAYIPNLMAHIPNLMAYIPNLMAYIPSSSLIGLQTCSTRGENHVWYWKPSHLPRANEVMDLREEPKNAALLNQHNS